MQCWCWYWNIYLRNKIFNIHWHNFGWLHWRIITFLKHELIFVFQICTFKYIQVSLSENKQWHFVFKYEQITKQFEKNQLLLSTVMYGYFYACKYVCELTFKSKKAKYKLTMRNEIQIVKGKRQYSETVTLSIYSANISTSMLKH